MGRGSVGRGVAPVMRVLAILLVICAWGVGQGRPAGAFVRTSSNWAYMLEPMGEDLVICPDGMPAGPSSGPKMGPQPGIMYISSSPSRQKPASRMASIRC
jgi:hypothetical protein